MKTKHILTFLLCTVLLQTQAQKKQWETLFDGSGLGSWHTYQRTDTQGWTIEKGTLTTTGKSGDLVSNKEYGDFELRFQFKVMPKGNSGVIYKVIEDPKNATYFSGPEYQVIDDAGYPPFNDGGKMVTINDKQKTGANYDMQSPNDLTVVKPAGEWNQGRIIIKNNHIEHWLNGKKVVEYEYGSEAWKQQLAASKFTKWAYATPHARGHIALQGHGDIVWYKNVKIREL
jgi:Domain of Unknown Function (DUF1080)